MGITRFFFKGKSSGQFIQASNPPDKVFPDENELKREVEKLAGRLEGLEIHFAQIGSLLNLRRQLPAVPPKHLQIRVAGKYYPEFFEHGLGMSRDMDNFLKEHGQALDGFENILDFGCGCGRFLIPMSHVLPPGKISGTDIDPEPVGWLRQNYPQFKDLAVNPVNPPTKYAEGSFDFVYSVSIFTHLPEDMQHAWLKELARILKPGGHGLFTTHGEKYHSLLAPPEWEVMKTNGFYYRIGVKTDGLPEFYQTSFHSPDYVRREWGKYFEVLAVKPGGLGSAQDMVLVRRRG